MLHCKFNVSLTTFVFFTFSQHHSPVTPVTSLCAEAREAAQKLLNHYVKVSFSHNIHQIYYPHLGKSDITAGFVLQVQGLIISQMLRKSVETRDWVNTIEPRNVRAVMKRVVEDTTSIDVQVTLWIFFAYWSQYHHLLLIVCETVVSKTCSASGGPSV